MSSLRFASCLLLVVAALAEQASTTSSALLRVRSEEVVSEEILPETVINKNSNWVYNSSQATTSLWFAAAAYCGKKEYETHVFEGPTTGFVWTKTISDPMDTQGYIGYLPSDESIYVVFRGSQDLRNWVTNLNAFKTNYTSWPDCNCQVHKGFYKQEQRVIKAILKEVKQLRKTFPGYKVKVTGHSLGAALAQLTSMDLLRADIPNTIYNFGQPRVGDQAYASFATKKLNIWRVTHLKDIVPHVPPTTKMGYYHVCTEQYENESGVVTECTDGCEDPNCADQWKLRQTNIADHLVYLGLSVSCEAVSSSATVSAMQPDMATD